MTTPDRAPVEHAFTAGPGIIRHLIKSQAGSLAKSLCELIANSIDAKASRINVTLTNDGFVIEDDGIGMATPEVIQTNFGQFGFDHNDGTDRINGQFGLGRGQCFAFARTTWRTHTHRIDVDVERRGLGYTLASDEPPVVGMRIEGAFYDGRSFATLTDDARDLEELVRYAHIPVLLNGEQINKPPASGRWTEEDASAYLRVGDGHTLMVYSQGLFVRAYSRSSVGVAGVLVTKIGSLLALNIARNDVLQASCSLWKRLRARLREIADATVKQNKTRVTEHDRDFMAAQLSDKGGSRFFDQPIFTLSNKRHVTFARLASMIKKAVLLTVAPEGDRVAEKALRSATAVVLSEQTLRRFRVDTPAAFVDRLKDLVSKAVREEPHLYALQWAQREFLTAKPIASLADSPAHAEAGHAVVADRDLSAQERNALEALRDTSVYVARAMGEALGRKIATRTLHAGESDAYDAWTDGDRAIWIERKKLDAAGASGAPGMLTVIMLLIHEYLHDTSDAGSHAHDEAFVQDFHNAVIDAGAGIQDTLRMALSYLHTNNRKRKSRSTAVLLDHLTPSDAPLIQRAAA